MIFSSIYNRQFINDNGHILIFAMFTLLLFQNESNPKTIVGVILLGRILHMIGIK